MSTAQPRTESLLGRPPKRSLPIQVSGTIEEGGSSAALFRRARAGCWQRQDSTAHLSAIDSRGPDSSFCEGWVAANIPPYAGLPAAFFKSRN